MTHSLAEESLMVYSHPLYESNPYIVEEASIIHSQEILRCFLEKNARQLRANSNGIFEYLRTSIDQINTFSLAWDLSFGSIHRQLLTGEPDSLPSATAVAIYMSSNGIHGKWSVNFPVSYQFRWLGFLLPSAKEIWCEINDEKAELFLTDEAGNVKQLSYSFQNANWDESEFNNELECLPLIETGTSRIIVCPQKNEMPEMTHAEGKNLSAQELKDFAGQCENAFRFLDAGAPVYRPWIERVVKHLVPCHTETDMLSSGSSSLLPGTLKLGFGKSPGATAEMIVHEATHQYYYIASKIGYMVDGTDQELYYSPAKGMPRPIEKIIVAYHAFANVYLFYRSCIKNGIDDGNYITINEERLLPQLRLMESHLRKTTSLTTLGKGIVNPLMSELREEILCQPV